MDEERRKKETRQKVITRQDAIALKEKANCLVATYVEMEKWRREHYESYKKLIEKLNSDWYFTETETLSEYLSDCYVYLIHEANNIFGVAKKPHMARQIFEHLTLGKYDLEKESILPFGKYYIEILCEIIEGATWYTRKDTDSMVKLIYEKFDLSNLGG